MNPKSIRDMQAARAPNLKRRLAALDAVIKPDNDNTFRGQIPDIPGNLTLFEVALKAANAHGDEAFLHRQAVVTGKIPIGLRYFEFLGSRAHLSLAE
ncbi:hypothetical protein EDF68_1284 [Ochrobactrum sp. BH3]|nr:hypothetical protein EDF68_1284 [Ochrobactrum sp. BH3]